MQTPKGVFYTTDAATIHKITAPDFSATQWAGGGNTVFNGEPIPKENIQFDPIATLAAGPGGVYVITRDDRGSTNRLLFISEQNGMVSERAPFRGFGPPNDGLGVEVAFAQPHSLDVDSAGIVYLGGDDVGTIRKLYPDDSITTFAPPIVEGWNGESEFRDGISYASDLSAGPDGTLYAVSGILGFDDFAYGGVFRIKPEDWENDTIPETVERDTGPFIAGRDDRAVDEDGDGLSNAVEFHLGLSPETPHPLASGTDLAVSDGNYFFTARTIPGQTYQLQLSTDLVTWKDHLLPFVAAGTARPSASWGWIATPRRHSFGWFKLMVGNE
ncbi:MAG: hypothetical protein KDN22_23150 [Verrucomicrobiae bacterium]|nr:hypothetical protein [Verrucomicrobiae bacterium]